MKKVIGIFGIGLAVGLACAGLTACSGLAGLLGLKDGADGATGLPGPTIRLAVGTEAVYSGGSVLLASAEGAGSATLVATTLSIVNKTGHTLALTGSPTVALLSSWGEKYDGRVSIPSPKLSVDTSGLSTSVAADAASGNSFRVILQGEDLVGGMEHGRIAIPLLDTSSQESYTFIAELYGLSGRNGLSVAISTSATDIVGSPSLELLQGGTVIYSLTPVSTGSGWIVPAFPFVGGSYDFVVTVDSTSIPVEASSGLLNGIAINPASFSASFTGTGPYQEITTIAALQISGTAAIDLNLSSIPW
ncbi:MAG TPA: hypothetical protein VMV44_13315 [Rectinemataceae bacterium]|nr:hypothetical protein [Rectinemataceae bacterium]